MEERYEYLCENGERIYCTKSAYDLMVALERHILKGRKKTFKRAVEQSMQFGNPYNFDLENALIIRYYENKNSDSAIKDAYYEIVHYMFKNID